MSMTDLAGHMGVTVATMSLAIDRLEAQGLRAPRPRSRATAAASCCASPPAGVRVREAKSVLDPVRVEQVLAQLSPADRDAALEGLRARWRARRTLTCIERARAPRRTLMKWMLFASSLALVALVVVIAARRRRCCRAITWRAARCALKRAPAEVWTPSIARRPAPDVAGRRLESQPPRRLVTRVKETEKMFGGTWTIADRSPEHVARSRLRPCTITEDGWVANPIFRFMSRFVFGHYATMDGDAENVARLNEDVQLPGRRTLSQDRHETAEQLNGDGSHAEARGRLGHRDGAGGAAERRQPARLHPRRHGDAPHRHRRRHRLPSPHAHPAGHRRRRRPAVPPLDQGRRSDHPEGARHLRVHDVARSAGRCLLRGNADRQAAADQHARS